MKAKEIVNENRIHEAADESWVQAYQALEANSGEPTPDRPTLFLKQIAMLARDAGFKYSNDIQPLIEPYVQDQRKRFDLTRTIEKMMPAAPSITDMRQYTQQSQAQASQFQQQQSAANLQHELSMQRLIQQNQLEQDEAQAIMSLDVEARQAIRERMQEMELQAKERLAQVEIDIRNSQEPQAEREQALTMARENNAHELAVIQLTAEGEYKKARLEADYQIKIRELENIDNAGERQNRLDVINAEKDKELEIIDRETSSKIRSLQAETDADRARSDTRIREDFMAEFKPIWGRLIDRASDVGRTLSQNIQAVNGALRRLAQPVMPQATDPVSEIRRVMELAGVQQNTGQSPAETAKDWEARMRQKNPGVKIVQAKTPGGPMMAYVGGKMIGTWPARGST
jgi:hypothetical protein